MLSNKLTFSLVLVLMLALVAGPAFAQEVVVSGNLNTAADATTGTATSAADNVLAANGFVVLEMPGQDAEETTVNGFVEGEVIEVTAAANQFPNIDELFRFGGTIELVLKQGTDLTGTPGDNETAKDLLHRLVITEIMWGVDEGVTGDAQALPQWIEVYNAGGDLAAGDDLRLVFTSNTRKEQDSITFKVSAADGSADAGNQNTTDINAYTEETVYTVVDRVSVINRFGSRWTPPGMSGRVTIPTPNPDGHQQSNLVSMYRKRGTNAGKTAYNSPADPNFADGTDGGQWIASVGRINLSGPHIGTPGYVQQDDGGQVVSAKAPASLPVGSVIINEIYNSATLRWIELHNTGSATVNVKKYRMHAVYTDADDKKQQDVVFSIPDTDTNIPAGGFLVVTNRQPADSILAGGVDLHDSNKFPAGASQLYIVTDVNMPETNFLLVLRNGNDKTNHEKIVDIAGNAFVKVADDTIVTDVWPLRGWTIPGDRDAADWGGADKSLMRNTGKTYARIEQKEW